MVNSEPVGVVVIMSFNGNSGNVISENRIVVAIDEIGLYDDELYGFAFCPEIADIDVMGCKVISSEYIVGDCSVLSRIVSSGISETFIDGNDTCVSMMESGSLAIVA